MHIAEWINDVSKINEFPGAQWGDYSLKQHLIKTFFYSLVR